MANELKQLNKVETMKDDETIAHVGMPAQAEDTPPHVKTMRREFMRKTHRNVLRGTNRWLLMVYDFVIILAVALVLFAVFPGADAGHPLSTYVTHTTMVAVFVFVPALILNVYRQIWRYASFNSYLRLIVAYSIGCVLHVVAQLVVPTSILITITYVRIISVYALSLLGSIIIRLLYQHLCVKAAHRSSGGAFLRSILKLAGTSVGEDEVLPSNPDSQDKLVRVAIIGAGRTGTALASELRSNPASYYEPVCFVDASKGKAGRLVEDIPVILESEVSAEVFDDLGVQEIVFALPPSEGIDRKKLYAFYQGFGRRIKTYDYPLGVRGELSSKDSRHRRMVREFDIEELLFRDPIMLDFDQIAPHYSGKIVLVTGGGGSIGSELARQVAKMEPKKLILLDIAENGAYDVQQELIRLYGSELDLAVEICNVVDRSALERAFAMHRPDVVLHAAAHKHVPLMEKCCVEAIQNNVFGTLNTVELAEKYDAHRFILISTDKAVNPTNVMGATKRICEMITQTHGSLGASSTIFSAVRFGNVLGSAGSVVPLFRKQILAGGPVTLTDRRIVRYFMTIPEATQLVLMSGTMAKSGELFALDMGKPVRIADLAENMIRLMGYEPGEDIEIIETGLRPGEKLYEELLVKNEELQATENDMIFIERDKPLKLEQLEAKLAILRKAVEVGDGDGARQALKETVPTFADPDVVNATAAAAMEITAAVITDNASLLPLRIAGGDVVSKKL